MNFVNIIFDQQKITEFIRHGNLKAYSCLIWQKNWLKLQTVIPKIFVQQNIVVRLKIPILETKFYGITVPFIHHAHDISILLAILMSSSNNVEIDDP